MRFEERTEVRERGAVDVVGHALAERRQRDEPQHVAPEPLDDRDQRQQADERHGDAVSDEQPGLRRAREVGRDRGVDRPEHRLELTRRQARLPRRDRRRAPPRARRDVAAVDESPVARDTVQHERPLVRMIGEDLLPAVVVPHGGTVSPPST